MASWFENLSEEHGLTEDGKIAEPVILRSVSRVYRPLLAKTPNFGSFHQSRAWLLNRAVGFQRPMSWHCALTVVMLIDIRYILISSHSTLRLHFAEARGLRYVGPPQRSSPLFTHRFFTAFAVGLVLTSISVAYSAPPDFAHDVAPIIREHCGKCHLGANKKGGLSLNTRATLLAGGDDGKVIVPGKSGESRLFTAVVSRDPDLQMPPQGARLTDTQVAKLKEWIDAGANWDEGFVFQKPSYEPPLKPRRPELPPIIGLRSHPIDRLIDADLTRQRRQRPAPLDDVAFARRTALDLTGLLPSVESLNSFLADKDPDRRTRWIDQLLADETAYAEHWLTFWNDLLRNDYGGTGFITGGRKQISKWLYQALIENKPYDQMARELISPSPESAGFGDGIRWRGTVSAGQTVEIQFAQSVGQAFLGINLKCASCHDSFIDRWKLDEAYGLAAIYATQPQEIHRCDKPIGRKAVASWLFPELGQVVATDPQPERLKQLASLMTHPENGRFTRTIVNRLWQRMMGRGIVHPVDAMQSEPWNADLLDYLAVDFAENRYDLKQTLKLIATSAAYQSQSEIIDPQADQQNYTYGGPRAKRMTAEQFVDAVWQITGSAPKSFDAPFVRGKADGLSPELSKLSGLWVWSSADASLAIPKAGEAISIRKKFNLPAVPTRAGGVFTCDNSCECYVNGKKVFSSTNWERIEGVSLESSLRAGNNEVLIVGKNGGSDPNPAAIFCEIFVRLPDGTSQTIASDATWEWTSTLPGPNGKFSNEPKDWANAIPAANQGVWGSRTGSELLVQLTHVALKPQRMVRASLLKADFLQKMLGRPNRDQIVTTRPNELSTLEAIDLNNAQPLADSLSAGSKIWLQKFASQPDKLVDNIYLALLSRSPSAEERALSVEALGTSYDEQSVQDLMWAVLMQPEFQLVR